MRKSIEVGAEICVDNSSMASVDQLVDVSHCVQRAAISPIGILFWLQIGLEDGFEYQNCCHFRCPVADSGYPQRPLFPVRLGYVYPPYREWLIGSAFQLFRQLIQPSLSSVRLDVLECLAVHSCCTAIGFAAFVGEGQDILSIHLVVQ